MLDTSAVAKEDPYLIRIVALVRSCLATTPTRGYLFGSRATGRADHGSDYDIAVVSDHDLGDALVRAALALEESTIPYKVDLVDLSTADEAFRAGVRKEGVSLWSD
jgi:predicted nucleotidyltransferase